MQQRGYQIQGRGEQHDENYVAEQDNGHQQRVDDQKYDPYLLHEWR